MREERGPNFPKLCSGGLQCVAQGPRRGPEAAHACTCCYLAVPHTARWSLNPAAWVRATFQQVPSRHSSEVFLDHTRSLLIQSTGVPALWKRSVPMNTFENQSGGKWTQLADRCTKSMETNHRYSETQFKALEAGCGDVELLRADDSRRLLESGTWLGNVVLRMCFYRLAECEGRSVITPDNTGSLLLGTTVPS
ncbi:uncharacterized protein LOC131496726 isoform X2 [Neofelis nebulosa]|uniref:uncharacterized protein LOC131496726 isoform X2 n=1 Tax=Neofelis nebulosa TaxID=61452 RepID=UPI002729EF34|nr:uncharacterized protein LOC131496726 isoform X2 [Neofelis nebulosa]